MDQHLQLMMLHHLKIVCIKHLKFQTFEFILKDSIIKKCVVCRAVGIIRHYFIEGKLNQNTHLCLLERFSRERLNILRNIL